MEFQDLDFHKVLYQTYLEPPGGRNQFLDRIRKKESYKREEFLIKLEEALDHFKQALEIESNKVKLRNVEDFGFPISALNRYEPLMPFSGKFSGHISKAVLNELDRILALYKFEQTAKKVNKLLDQRLLEAIENPKQSTETKNEVENKFNSMPIEEVREHFRPLTEKKNPKKQIWMTNEDFEIFIKRSFGKNKDLEKPKINLGHGSKMALVKLFYKFYEKCQIEDYNQNRSKNPFLNLLKNAFLTNEFNDLDISNFKTSNSKYEWL